HLELAAVALRHMLDDRQPEPGAAGVARAAAVDPIEALGQARQMLARDADARVAHFELAAAVAARRPRHVDAPARWRVAHRVVDEVADRAQQLELGARNLHRTGPREAELMAPGRERLRIGTHLHEDALHRDPAIGAGTRAA